MLKTVLFAAALVGSAAPALAQTAPVPAPPHAPAHADMATHAATPTIEAPIKDLLAHEATAAVLEKHLPGLSKHPMLEQFQDMTLGQVAPLSGGAVTPAIIEAIDTDLKALPAA
ncbi:hypothetical protein BZG35_09215 [Brevundimonas sp. LM2]|uniref:hypothetical protein n=1 Tax=Brevundimonas sp. LM2 TaxID=1938605 RepID=UPI000983DE51|nr:hypothetical protein [Brevundimonas sp. LM2]AQR61814.1 hypothetical protein BZG35_09215 [Brevundimonas sp. LM2]